MEQKRALAYITTVDEIVPIEGYDRVEYARTRGWWVVVSKMYNLKIGDKCVYFEIDSKVPETDERFKFLESKKYRIKTQRMCKVYSQGLLIPLVEFPELEGLPVDTDVTDKLGVTYYIPEDNHRKGKTDPTYKYKSMARRHPKVFSNVFVKKIMKFGVGREFMFLLFGDKNDKPREFPTFVIKTDEERIENRPGVLKDLGEKWVLTEKLDGTSCTYALKRSRLGKYEFFVCSRNICKPNMKRETYKGGDIYWDLAFKYDIENVLKDYLDKRQDLDWAYIQGEGVGNVQGNPLKLLEDDLYVFNLVDSKNGRYGSLEACSIIQSYGMKFVPIYGIETLKPTMEEMKLDADGNSMLNPKVKREGIVYRSIDGKRSFKNVSRKYLLKKGE